MKNRNLILSVLFWMVTSVAMAVTLPSSSYNAFDGYGSQDVISFSVRGGSSILGNAAVVDDSRAATCNVDKQDPAAMQKCEDCCFGAVLWPCLQQGGNETTCGPGYLECINSCMGASLPLGTPLLLLPFLAIYAVIRRRKQA